MNTDKTVMTDQQREEINGLRHAADVSGKSERVAYA
jgi:hypothetical protein